jgi:hypothetical protein
VERPLLYARGLLAVREQEGAAPWTWQPPVEAEIGEGPAPHFGGRGLSCWVLETEAQVFWFTTAWPGSV